MSLPEYITAHHYTPGCLQLPCIHSLHVRVWLFLHYWFWSWGRSADVYQAGPVETLEKCFAIAQDHCIRGQGLSGIEGVDCFQDGLVRSLTNETLSYYIDVSKPASAKWKRGRTQRQQRQRPNHDVEAEGGQPIRSLALSLRKCKSRKSSKPKIYRSKHDEPLLDISRRIYYKQPNRC